MTGSTTEHATSERPRSAAPWNPAGNVSRETFAAFRSTALSEPKAPPSPKGQRSRKIQNSEDQGDTGGARIPARPSAQSHRHEHAVPWPTRKHSSLLAAARTDVRDLHRGRKPMALGLCDIHPTKARTRAWSVRNRLHFNQANRAIPTRIRRDFNANPPGQSFHVKHWDLPLLVE